MCELTLAEAVPADIFTSHKTLGELILIDRVSNMTSACGVIEDLSEKGGLFTHKASFRQGNLEAGGDIFEEFCFDTVGSHIMKYQTVSNTYTVGDEIPTTGESYHYPDNFDIVVLRDHTAVKIRDRKISEILPVSEYHFDSAYPLVNGRGFEILVSFDEEFRKFIDSYSISGETDRKGLFSKYLRFDTYRKIVIH